MSLFGRPADASAPRGGDFSERMRKVLATSREEAARLGHEYIGTEHMVLGLTRDHGGVAEAVLAGLGIDAGSLRDMIEGIVRHGTSAHESGVALPYTSRAKKVLELATAEARALRHGSVGSEHLLLGLIAEGRGIGAQALTSHGATLEAARAETVRLLGPGGADPDGAGGGPPPA